MAQDAAADILARFPGAELAAGAAVASFSNGC